MTGIHNMLHSLHLLPNFPFSLSHRLHPSPLSTPNPSPSYSSSLFNFRPTTIFSLRTKSEPWLALAQLPDEPTTPPSEQEQQGPIQLPSISSSSSSSSPLFGNPDDPSPLQVATSVLLTGAISVFLFRSLRRRAKRAKELRVRSSGIKKDLKEEALDSLKAMRSASIDAGAPPSPAQALLGGLAAGVITIVLYKFTTTIEAALNRQTISDNFSVRQITITIRTIINGLCYLATFVFGINSVGLILYSGQLAINSIMEPSMSNTASSKDEEQLGTANSSANIPTDNVESNKNDGEQSSDRNQ
eukprot:TRINITY_DN657_c0_g2_i1.p1 TRINITY_DN657_c0_g2~~TRINITY_DN657_c0_g2_i1.p1  ORF type:complete len:301 (-),score=51.68 TRINITY_DN657_c0_g2_i1:104-1006(-)